MAKKIALLNGDGIGPEVMRETVKVLDALAAKTGQKFEYLDAPFGASAYFQEGHPFPEQSKLICDQADSILKGPIGLGPEATAKIPVEMRPERAALLPLRRRYDCYANFRPVTLPLVLKDVSPLKDHVVAQGIDFIIVRELVGGLYFGRKERGTTDAGVRYVKETLEYDEVQIERIVRFAFGVAEKRKKVLHNIHKSNVLTSSVLWNEVLAEVAVDYPHVEVVSLLVDAAATAMVLNPGQFDVMVMENMFGDILSDEGGGILGSLGLMPSACIGPEKAYYEPSHGSAPDIAGQNIANPYSMIGSAALMCQMSLGMQREGDAIFQAMINVFTAGYRTPDLAGHTPGVKVVSTSEFGDQVVAELHKLL